LKFLQKRAFPAAHCPTLLERQISNRASESFNGAEQFIAAVRDSYAQNTFRFAAMGVGCRRRRHFSRKPDQ
jgi:hypothetical protein